MTVLDLARFGEEHVRLANGRSTFLSAQNVRRLHYGDGGDYGLGWSRDSLRGGPLLLHNGSNTLWFALLMVAPASNLSVAIVTNAGRRLNGETAVMTAAGRIAALVLA
jgi:CubicO group peptidase (beta-lactamase class C family)